MFRIGQGIDTHRYSGAAGKMVLGGVLVSEEYGIVAHSDGDVLLHALTDALLGAVAAGDIGEYYSDKAAENAGRCSVDFVDKAMEVIAAKGFLVVNADCTVVAERPKISKYKQRIAESIGAMLAIPAERVGVKAKTAEQMDAIGRCEGIGATVVVLLQSIDN